MPVKFYLTCKLLGGIIVITSIKGGMFIAIRKRGDDLMTRELIDEILRDIGLESIIDEESEKEV